MSVSLLDMQDVYKGQEKILVAVDCIVFGFDGNEIKLLLFKRKVEPWMGEWSLVGSFIKNHKSLEDSAAEVLYESTGIKDVFLEELKTFSTVDRDAGGRVISVAFFSLIRIDEIDIETVEHFNAKWFSLDKIPKLILDHDEMVQCAIHKLKTKVRRKPVGFNLLPEKFTLPQLQVLYESIYQKKMDSRNFRKKIISFDILTRTHEKDKSSSKKGAYLYRFNPDKFEEFEAKGYQFEL